MNKEYKIKLDLNKKLYNKKMTFNQFDENVNDFYIEVTKNNEVVKDLDKSIVTLVAIKPNNTVDAQFIEVKEGQIYADLKPSMCDLVGNYQAKAMIVLEGEIATTDIINYSVNEDKIISRLNDDVVSDERFTLFTDALARLSTIEITEEQRMINEAERILAEENRKIEEAKRVEAELIRQHEEADRAKYDATRESNENIRKQNESIRLANEANRIDEEVKRVEEENKRKLAEEERKANYNFMTEDEERRRSEANAHKEAEVLRVQAETNRVNEEAKRRTTEQGRVSAENTRVSNENTREANETTRQTNETKRAEAETQRQNRYNSFIVDAEANANNFENYTNTAKVKEEERKSNELDRKSQEDRRISNEVERISNENTRKANEKQRQEEHSRKMNEVSEVVSDIQKDYDSLQKIIIDENASANLQNQINQTNSQLEHKASEVDLEVERKRIDLLTKVENNQTEGNAELLDIRIGADGKTYNTAGDAIRRQFSKNNDNISSINASMSEFKELDVTIENGFRDASSGTFTEHSGFKCIYIDCKEGEEYMCNTHVSTSSVAVVNFYVNGSLYSKLDKGAIGIHENYKFTVPEGITQLSITSKSNYTPSIKKIGLIDVAELKEEVNSILTTKETKECCYRTEDTFQYIFKYNNNYDAMIRIFKHGPNKLPQLATSLKRENANNFIELSKSGFSTEFFKITTDTISPYRGLNAKNNADGDSNNLDVWVGGYHGYDGSINASVPVAKNISFDVFVDNRKIDGENTDLIEINKNAKVVVVNQIQGCNTMKTDGTGRYILEEKVTYTFSELGKIDVSVEFKALEDLSINYYYGLTNTLSTYKDFLLFENDNVNKTPLIDYDFSTNVSSGDKLNSDCISFLAKKGNDCMITRLNNEYGLGKLRFNDNTKVCHFTTAKKLYFNLITSNFDMVENQVVSWEGSYKFYSEI